MKRAGALLVYRVGSRASSVAFVLLALPHYPHLGVVWLGAALVAYRAGDVQIAQKN